MTKTEYTDRVYGYLSNMKINEARDIDFLPEQIIPTPIAKAFFIDILKDFIKRDEGRAAGYYIELNSTHSAFRKQAYFTAKP